MIEFDNVPVMQIDWKLKPPTALEYIGVNHTDFSKNPMLAEFWAWIGVTSIDGFPYFRALSSWNCAKQTHANSA